MLDLKPLIQNENYLKSSKNAFIADNYYAFSQNVREHRNPACDFRVDLFELSRQYEEETIIYAVNQETLISSIRLEYAIPEELFSQTYQRLKNLPEDNFEIRTKKHIKTIEDNFVDLWGEPTQLIDCLESYLCLTPPTFNNNKVFSNRDDHFSLENLHVDSFYEQRTDKQGKRLKLWRYFLNLGKEDRKSVVGVHHPEMVNCYLDKNYREDHLGKFLEECDYSFPALILNIKGRTSHSIYGFKILATHLLHAPYNKKDDFLSVINTLK